MVIYIDVGGAGKWKMYRWAGQEKHTTGINVAGNTNTTNSNDSPHTVKYRSVSKGLMQHLEL